MCFICTKLKKGLNETDDDSVMQRIANRSFVKEKNNFLVCLNILVMNSYLKSILSKAYFFRRSHS